MVSIPSIPQTYLRPIEIDGLHGRMLELPYNQKEHKPTILLVYGHHSSLERMFSISQAMNKYGPVVLPDMPGFGGMPALMTIGKKPSIDNLADYLAAFIDKYFPANEKFVLEGLSLGFVVATRMLQRHPKFRSRILHLVSMAGFVHGNDFAFSPGQRRIYARTARFFAKKYAARSFDKIVLQRPIIATTYHLRARSHPKMKGYTWQERNNLINFEVTLWKSNEVQTYFTTLSEMLELDLTQQPLPLAVEHVAVSSDQYFNNARVIEHMNAMFSKVGIHEAILPNHVPTILEDVKDAKRLIPDSLAAIFRHYA